MDAPIGYLASLKNHCEKYPEFEFDDYWDKDSQAEGSVRRQAVWRDA